MADWGASHAHQGKNIRIIIMKDYQPKICHFSLKNMVQGSLVNGSVGKVTGFLTTHEGLERNLKIAMPDGNQEPRLSPRGMLYNLLHSSQKDDHCQNETPR